MKTATDVTQRLPEGLLSRFNEVFTEKPQKRKQRDYQPEPKDRGDNTKALQDGILDLLHHEKK